MVADPTLGADTASMAERRSWCVQRIHKLADLLQTNPSLRIGHQCDEGSASAASVAIAAVECQVIVKSFQP